MAREQIQNSRKKVGPLDTIQRARLEKKMSTKVKAADRVHGQKKEHNPYVNKCKLLGEILWTHH
jgi:hypothetical protein